MRRSNPTSAQRQANVTHSLDFTLRSRSFNVCRLVDMPCGFFLHVKGTTKTGLPTQPRLSCPHLRIRSFYGPFKFSYETFPTLANTRHSAYAGPMLVHHLRRWTNIKPTCCMGTERYKTQVADVQLCSHLSS